MFRFTQKPSSGSYSLCLAKKQAYRLEYPTEYEDVKCPNVCQPERPTEVSEVELSQKIHAFTLTSNKLING